MFLHWQLSGNLIISSQSILSGTWMWGQCQGLSLCSCPLVGDNSRRSHSWTILDSDSPKLCLHLLQPAQLQAGCDHLPSPPRFCVHPTENSLPTPAQLLPSPTLWTPLDSFPAFPSSSPALSTLQPVEQGLCLPLNPSGVGQSPQGGPGGVLSAPKSGMCFPKGK